MTDDVLVAAMLRAHADGADVITLSIGGEAGWSETPAARAASALVAQGTVVTIAAGNSGSNGAFTASTPATGPNVIAVASVDKCAARLARAARR